MRYSLTILSLLLAVAALLYAADEKTEDAALPWLTAARISKVPEIDGRVASGEWAECSAFVGYRDFVSRALDPLDVVTFCGYDDRALCLCFVIPLGHGEEPHAEVMAHDGAVHRDDAVEVILLPDPKGDVRQLVVNCIGTVFDRKGAQTEWTGKWLIKTGRGRSADLPQELRHIESYWCVEMSLPFTDLGVSMPKPDEVWRVNFCLDGHRPLAFAPTFSNYLEQAQFARLSFLPPGHPSLHMTGFGALCYGRLNLTGALRNPSNEASDFSFRITARKEGTRLVERTGFDEVEGALVKFDETISVQAQTTLPLALDRLIEDVRLNVINLEIKAVSKSGRVVRLYANEADLQILPPLRVLLENYPTNEYLVAQIDATGLTAPVDGRTASWRILDAGGKTVMNSELALAARMQETQVAYSNLSPGQYDLVVDVRREGKTLASSKQRFHRVKNPAWFRNDIGKSNIILPPFTPLEYADRQVSMWGRKMTWRSESLLPASVESGGQELFAAPIRLVVTTQGKERTIPLDSFSFTKQEKHRGEMTFSGRAGELGVEAAAWVEYDGLLWLDLRIQGGKAAVDGCRIELPMRNRDALYYHGVPDRTITGRVKDAALELPFQHYFWVGGCERGIGFIIESMRNVCLDETQRMYRILPHGDHALWQIHLIQKTVTGADLRYRFGLQATPVRPLPPDYHSWFSANYELKGDSECAKFAGNVDFTTIHPPFGKSKEGWWADAFCDPMGIKADKVAAIAAKAHAVGTPVILYHAPLDFTEVARPEHQTYAHEWMVAPRTQWKSFDFLQTRACAKSSFQDWLLFAFRKTVRECGLDGLYFDGGISGPCRNVHHGCGWVDEKGVIQPTWPVLENREFQKRVAVMLHEEVQKRAVKSPAAAARPGWPAWYTWAHVSGAVCPPILSFNTAYFCGEWFKGPILLGKGYDELLTLDAFRPRYLSAPWGVPNFFLPITLEMKEGEPRSKQTECILAYLLPQGVPLFSRYLNRPVRETVLRAMMEFGTRYARFTPAWRSDGPLALDAGGNPDILLGAWERNGKALAVISNVGGAPAKVKLSYGHRKTVRCTAVFPHATEPTVAQAPLEIEIGPHTFVMMRMEP